VARSKFDRKVNKVYPIVILFNNWICSRIYFIYILR